MDKINLADAFASIADAWQPHVAAEIGDCQVRLAKMRGAFDWHHHAAEDELFLVVAGRMRMGLRDRAVDLGPGEMIVVPRGVEHRPEALDGECQVLLVEPASTLNTGVVETERTVRDLPRLA